MEIHLDMITTNTENTPRHIIPESNENTYPYLKYGTITVVYDTFEPGFDELWRFLGYEHITPKDKMVADFKSTKNMYDIDLVDLNESIHFVSQSNNRPFPSYILHYKSDNVTMKYFYNTPQKVFPGIYKEPYINKVFQHLQEFKHHESSIYNGIYTYYPKSVSDKLPELEIAFGLLKLKPTKNTCRFLFSYNEKVLNEEEIVYIVKKIILHKS